ncbi:hypothetical protein C8Q70DRAFT_1052795 [Cubamyces menziesii]|uniref:PUB domain-containing protein n=1 Tax=Trametes cubensis TaxID=1111947 RepID=A0AAD7XAS4_9APHY|nr:hypothetical protein C8Q70DRAFT_1052795 [Cubamyces menziesii]KAJ8481957.1 hypothetical protein ONZ51_g5662 [Trametes cubensis]
MAVDRAKVAAAAQRNVDALRKADPAQVLYTPFDSEWSIRQAFRRRIYRDIFESDSGNQQIALQSLQTVLKLTENLLAKPEEPAYRKFRRHNGHIKRLVIEPKGVLQLVVDLGWREKIIDFESCYVFTGKNYNNLRVGASVIKEILHKERIKQHDMDEARSREAAERISTQEKERLRLQFLDDRLSVAARAQRERRTGVEVDVKSIPARKGEQQG